LVRTILRNIVTAELSRDPLTMSSQMLDIEHLFGLVSSQNRTDVLIRCAPG